MQVSNQAGVELAKHRFTFIEDQSVNFGSGFVDDEAIERLDLHNELWIGQTALDVRVKAEVRERFGKSVSESLPERHESDDGSVSRHRREMFIDELHEFLGLSDLHWCMYEQCVTQLKISQLRFTVNMLIDAGCRRGEIELVFDPRLG